MKDWQVCLEFFGGKNGKNYIKSFWNLGENVSIPKCMNEILTLHDLLWRKKFVWRKKSSLLKFLEKITHYFSQGGKPCENPRKLKNWNFSRICCWYFFFKLISFFSILKNTFIGIYSLFIIIFAYRNYLKYIVTWLEQGFSRIK